MRKCRFCHLGSGVTFVDLGVSPLANSYLRPEQLAMMERFFPLHAYVCKHCFLVQVDEFETPEGIFSDYAYFSSFASSWVEHARCYVDMIVPKVKLNATSLVVELASNDGYLLQHFKKHNVPVLGIEPALNVAEVARTKGIPTEAIFFGTTVAASLAQNGKAADLVIANNVLAHVPDLNDFVKGIQTLLKTDGVFTGEFPHLANLVEKNQFDTIYHEHFSYFSFFVIRKIFAHAGLRIFDVEELSTHGGSLRIYACRNESTAWSENARVGELENREETLGMKKIQYYSDFSEKVKEIKRQLLSFLIEAKNQKKKVVCYGAPAKGNTLLNYCGVRTDFIDYTVDLNPHKQAHFLPGTRIPIYAPEKILETRPDYVLILPWNLKTEITESMKEIRSWGGKFVVPIPHLHVCD